MFKILVFTALIATAFGLPKIRSNLNGRIIGGEDAAIEDYPYQASLLIWGAHFCGGSIISETSIVTAAHCVELVQLPDLSVRVGSSIRNSGGIVNSVEHVYKHPKFDWDTVDYDVAILKLERPLEFGPGIQPIDLHTETPVENTPAEISGWGAVEEGGKLTNHLQVATIEITNHEACNIAHNGEVTSRMICAGLPEGGKDSCTGDNGGPLVVDGKLAGISSFGYGCGRAYYPGVYADVAVLYDFIAQYL